jgi:hypothetical protein
MILTAGFVTLPKLPFMQMRTIERWNCQFRISEKVDEEM